MTEKRKLSEPNGASVKRSKTDTRYTGEDAVRAELLRDLTSENQETRLEAAAEIVRIAASEPSPIASKICVRLVRGLCSDQKAARIGYHMALTELLSVALGSSVSYDLREESINGYCRLVEEQTVTSQDASKDEVRAHFVGRISAYHALIKSGGLFCLDGSVVNLDGIIVRILEVMKQAPRVAEECGSVLCDFVAALHARKASEGGAKRILTAMEDYGLIKSAEGLAVYFTVMHHYPDLEVPTQMWRKRGPLVKKELSTTVEILHGNYKSIKASGMKQDSVHFVWDYIFERLMKEEDDSIFSRFWTMAVDEFYFSKSASSEKKQKGFKILSRILTLETSSMLKDSLSPRLVSCLMNQTKSSDRHLYSTSMSIMKALVKKIKWDDRAAITVVSALLSNPANNDFEKIANSKLVTDILLVVGDETLYEISELLKIAAFKANSRRDACVRVVLDQFNAVAKHRLPSSRPSPNGAEPRWITRIAATFWTLGYHNTPEPISHQIRQTSQFRFQGLIMQLIQQDSHRGAALMSLYIATNRADDENSRGLGALNNTQLEAVDSAGHIFHKLRRASELPHFMLLLGFTIFQVESGEDGALDMLRDLLLSYKGLADGGASKDQATQAVVEIILDLASRQSSVGRKLAEDTFKAIVNDINRESIDSMLAILEQKETTSGQKELFKPSDEPSDDDDDDDNGSDVGVLENGAAPANDDASSSSSSSNSASDAESSGSDDDNSAAAAEELARFDAALARALHTSRAPLDSTLAAATDAATNADANAQSSSDESMDDEQMLALEPALAAVFRERALAGGADPSARTPSSSTKQKSQRTRDARAARDTMLSFKNRVLDMLLVFARQRHGDTLALALVRPLLALVRATGAKQIAEKAAHVLAALFEAAKKKGLPGRPRGMARRQWDDGVFGVLQDVHDEALRPGSRLHAATASRSSLFLARCLLVPSETGKGDDGTQGQADGEAGEGQADDEREVFAANRERLVDLYARTHKRRLQMKGGAGAGGLTPAFWSEWVTWSLTFRGDA